MKTPVCIFDLRSGVLCSRCEEKLREGLVSNLDISLMTILLEEERRSVFLQRSEYIKSVNLSHTVIVLLRGEELSDSQLSALSKRLSEQIGKGVRILSDIGDQTKFYESLVSPARLLAINKIWLPDGTEEIRLIIDDPRRLPLGVEDIAQTAKVLKGVNVRIDYI